MRTQESADLPHTFGSSSQIMNGQELTARLAMGDVCVQEQAGYVHAMRELPICSSITGNCRSRRWI